MFSRSRVTFSKIFYLLSLFLISQAFAHKSCGTTKLAETIRQHRAQPGFSRIALEKAAMPCPAESFYDSVYSKKTEHFQIFYTLSGPNQTTEEFVDTTAKYAEFAYNFHTHQLGFLPPMASEFAYHYQQEVSEGLYPIEIIDIDMLRGTQYYLGGKCHGCYGLTIPDDKNYQKSELMLDNDFRYTPDHGAIKDTLIVDGKKCIYEIADQDLFNEAHNYSYADHWVEGIQVTAVHELYHAVQLRYLDMTFYDNFWFEASASGVEEIAVPHVDDYISYLPAMAKSVGVPLDKMMQDYGAGIFYIYLYNHVDKKMDRAIWEAFAKDPNQKFNEIIDDFTKKKSLSMDSIFQDFSTRLAFSGERAYQVDSTMWITNDEKIWPEFMRISVEENSMFTPNLQPLAYQYYTYGRPELGTFSGKASLAAYKGNTAEIYNIQTTNAADSLYTALKNNPSIDSVLWIFSRFGDSLIPTVIRDPTIRAYPTPWRHGDLCFTSLPANKKFIEIRNRRGDLITREKYTQYNHCISEEQVRKLMTPGVYRFRAGSSGKTKDFIIIY